MAEARVTLDFLAHMLDLPEGTVITHIQAVAEGEECYAQIRFAHENVGALAEVQLVYGEDEYGLPALVSIDPV